MTKGLQRTRAHSTPSSNSPPPNLSASATRQNKWHSLSDGRAGQHICAAHSLYANERERFLLPSCQTKNPRRIRRRSCSLHNILDAKISHCTVGGRATRRGFTTTTTKDKSFHVHRLPKWPHSTGPTAADESPPSAVPADTGDPEWETLETSYINWHHLSEAVSCLIVSKVKRDQSRKTKAQSSLLRWGDMVPFSFLVWHRPHIWHKQTGWCWKWVKPHTPDTGVDVC